MPTCCKSMENLFQIVVASRTIECAKLLRRSVAFKYIQLSSTTPRTSKYSLKNTTIQTPYINFPWHRESVRLIAKVKGVANAVVGL